MKKTGNEFDPFLNECQIYVWEWYIPEQKVRFGIPSLNSLWIDDQEKNIKLATMLERVHPDDIQKVLVRRTSPLFRSDKMFEVDLRLNVAAELTPDGQSAGRYEWYGFRGKTLSRDRHGRPTYVRGVAINLDQRYRAQTKLINQKERQMQNARNQADYCASVIHEVESFLRNLGENADTLIASDTAYHNDESRLMRLSALKDQVGHILELTDKVRYYSTGEQDTAGVQQIQSLSLWEHMAELQQVYSLKAGSQMRFYFSNLYDNLEISVNVKLFDLLLDNVIASIMRANSGNCITISYVADVSSDKLNITVSCVTDTRQTTANPAGISSSALGISVCQLIAKRIWGDVDVVLDEQGKIRYVITLPLDARQAIRRMYSGKKSLADSDERDDLDLLEDTELDLKPEAAEDNAAHMALPHVLIGMSCNASLYRNQHLFDVTVTCSTDELSEAYSRLEPDIVFLDYRLPGKLSTASLIEQIHRASPDTPIIVTDDTAQRPLHKHVQQLGARYLLNNPLSLRKVNMMIKKYLK